jgi:acetyltransferase-like isoleucine patch superfamily enzyme
MNLIAALRAFWFRTAVPLRVRADGVRAFRGVRFFGMPIIARAPGSSIELGEASVLCSDSRYTALGVSHPVILRTLSPGALIQIGANTGISGASICAATGITIGADCLIGADTIIADTDFHPIEPHSRRGRSGAAQVRSRPIHIGDNVFLGARVVVLKGVTIGRDSVIGAGSIVRHNIPAGSIALGNPAAVVGSVRASAIEDGENARFE